MYNKTIGFLFTFVVIAFLNSCQSADYNLYHHFDEEPSVLHGVVKTTYGEIVPEATVYYQEKSKMTDNDGNYYFSYLEEAAGNIIVKKKGFDDYEGYLTIYPGDQVFNIGLKLDPFSPEFIGCLYSSGSVSSSTYRNLYESRAVVAHFNLNRFVYKNVSKATLNIKLSYDKSCSPGTIYVRHIPKGYNWLFNDSHEFIFEDISSFPYIADIDLKLDSNNTSIELTIDLSEWILPILKEFGMNNGFVFHTNTDMKVKVSTLSLEIE